MWQTLPFWPVRASTLANRTDALMIFMLAVTGFFTVMMLFVPSGLTLYIFVNNLLSILQQQVVNRMQEKTAKA